MSQSPYKALGDIYQWTKDPCLLGAEYLGALANYLSTYELNSMLYILGKMRVNQIKGDCHMLDFGGGLLNWVIKQFVLSLTKRRTKSHPI